MQDRHVDRKKYFLEQSTTVEKYVIPFIRDTTKIDESTEVLEIGCGEGGNLLPLADIGCRRVVGVDMAQGKITNAANFFSDHPHKDNITFICADVFSIDDLGQFDVIIMRDVLEHIHGQEKFMRIVKRFLKPDGKLFLGFPPWYNPFGGHQQICENGLLSKLPYFHILPKPIYRSILKSFGESDAKIESLLEIKDTGITIERFERILKHENYHKDKRCFYWINPNYEVKFGLTPREMWGGLAAIPWVRNFFITTNYYVVSPKVNATG